MKPSLVDYAAFLVMQATVNQPKDTRRVDIGEAMDWLAVEKIEASDFNAALGQVERIVERAKRIASVVDADEQRALTPAPLKQRDRTKADREFAAQVEATKKRHGEEAARAVEASRNQPALEAPEAPRASDRDLADFDLDEGQQQDPPGTEVDESQNPAA